MNTTLPESFIALSFVAPAPVAPAHEVEDIGDDVWDEDGYDDTPIEFAGYRENSALRAGKRIHACPTCHQPRCLSDEDKRLGYQCDDCADRAEGRPY